MIFEKLTLNNFGLFRGKQVLDLHPPPGNGHAAPIILFGGMNGGVKTTILDAVKLALYGSRGNYSKKANIAYDEFLRHSINRGVAISTGASVALDFRITRDGEEHAYQVHRGWQQRGRTLRERVCVCKDGVQDQYAADHWTDLVEEETMRTFLTRATAAKIDQLSRRVTKSFRFLLRKKTLVHEVQIDPATFAISLFDDHGHEIPKHRLSEGEKQVFAVSVLWGLAQSSPRPLPAIIDTPMARLDSEHRLHLIERYFPNASHQVIILSTDTKVNQDFYAKLQPHMARAYHLNYDEAEKVTIAREGYFWEPSK